MPPPHQKSAKASLLEIFILDAEGGYAGEYLIEDECPIEYDDLLRAVPEAGLGDQESVYLGEYRATALHGNRLSLVAISRGPLTLEDLVWAKAALVATEAHLSSEDGTRTPGAEPDRAVMESLVSALERREVDIAARETALKETLQRMRREAEEARRPLEEELRSLRAHVARLEAEGERLRRDAARQQAAITAATNPSDAEREAAEPDQREQQRDLALREREEKLRAWEAELAAEAERLAAIRRAKEELLTKIEASKKPDAEGFDVDAARKEIEMRVKILQRKALDLLDREEKLREREAALQRALGAAPPVTVPGSDGDEDTETA